MVWKFPNSADLSEIVSGAIDSLHICSPFITSSGIQMVTDALPSMPSNIEIWTKLDSRDWLTGASEPDSLLDFIDNLPGDIDVRMRKSEHLHAKFILANKTEAIVGSQNLTRGGYSRNIEIARIIRGTEVGEITHYVSIARSRLTYFSIEELREFVSQCQDQAKDKEALLDIIREAAEEISPTDQAIAPLSEFVPYCMEQAVWSREAS